MGERGWAGLFTGIISTYFQLSVRLNALVKSTAALCTCLWIVEHYHRPMQLEYRLSQLGIHIVARTTFPKLRRGTSLPELRKFASLSLYPWCSESMSRWYPFAKLFSCQRMLAQYTVYHNKIEVYKLVKAQACLHTFGFHSYPIGRRKVAYLLPSIMAHFPRLLVDAIDAKAKSIPSTPWLLYAASSQCKKVDFGPLHGASLPTL